MPTLLELMAQRQRISAAADLLAATATALGPIIVDLTDDIRRLKEATGGTEPGGLSAAEATTLLGALETTADATSVAVQGVNAHIDALQSLANSTRP